MQKISLCDVKSYDASGHFGMTAMRLHGKEETGASKFWVGLSHFLPGGDIRYQRHQGVNRPGGYRSRPEAIDVAFDLMLKNCKKAGQCVRT